MMVLFVSQCEKKAIGRTQQILDAFADRLGDRTWHTLMTEEGLKAVHKLLKQTASKNTAVACHWLRSRQRRELLWVVGQKEKFNIQGIVPVNYTQKNWQRLEGTWHFLPLLQSLTALAALLHDWGKATRCFQEKLQGIGPLGDPLRHEWISGMIFSAFVSEATSDREWLSRLAQGQIDERMLGQKVTKAQCEEAFETLPPVAQILNWLILTHHRLPGKNKNQAPNNALDLESFFEWVEPGWGYENKRREEESKQNYQERLNHCFEFPQGFLSESSAWIKAIKKYAGRVLEQLDALENHLSQKSWRLLLLYARLSLMLGDHQYSSEDRDDKWKSGVKLYANTDRKTREMKQQLDEHLVGVCQRALRVAFCLPQFEQGMTKVDDNRMLKRKSPAAFAWQDKAVLQIKSWRKDALQGKEITQVGFFAVNMASTGCGKTIANAKIMRSLSQDMLSLRYVLALGLRTLTLQTGQEYREKIGLDNTELAVLIGSQAVKDLFENSQHSQPSIPDGEMSAEAAGSESLEMLLDGLVDFESTISNDVLQTVLKRPKDQELLYAPVLTCTIDHLMSATETRRGGRYILPTLRLMSSDLVIDEIDDFDGADLIAIGRLIHLAGMLGRKVMISSATIPPDLALGYFQAYQQGWSVYAQLHTNDAYTVSKKIGCAWIDEFGTRVETIVAIQPQTLTIYQDLHQKFVQKRLRKLTSKALRLRKGEIIACSKPDLDDVDSLQREYFSIIQEAVIAKHNAHKHCDPITGKKVSFGVVRVANIDPCVALSQYLMQAEWPVEMTPKVMSYHSRQVLLLRSIQEAHLDAVLKRKEQPGESAIAFENPVIRRHLDTTDTEEICFVLVATPVEEVGRDHDFDWGIIEPSSYRSIVQLSGRVWRHRKMPVDKVNVGLLQYNLKGFQGKYPAFQWPGYEGATFGGQTKFKLKSHDLETLLQGVNIQDRIDASPRIFYESEEKLNPDERLADLEHLAMKSWLANFDAVDPASLQGWLTQDWWLTAFPQILNPFRQSTPQMQLHLIWDEHKQRSVFNERSPDGHWVKKENTHLYQIEHRTEPLPEEHVWLHREYHKGLLTRQALELDESGESVSLTRISKKYGEINVPIYDGNSTRSTVKYIYSDQFGLSRKG